MLTAAHGVISQLYMLRISECVSWVLRIPELSVSCHKAMTRMIKPCALIIPDSVHVCCTLVPEMLLSNQQVRSADSDYLGMQSVTACNNTCIRDN